MAIAPVSPVTGETLKSFDELTPEELEDERLQAVALEEARQDANNDLDAFTRKYDPSPTPQ